jgi:hypothetical protein
LCGRYSVKEQPGADLKHQASAYQANRCLNHVLSAELTVLHINSKKNDKNDSRIASSSSLIVRLTLPFRLKNDSALFAGLDAFFDGLHLWRIP